MLSITEVCRRTGLSARALRFYEARGLVRAQRSAAGQRRYGASEVARLHQVTVLKRAGFSLSQIAALTGEAWLDLDRLIAAQVADLTARRVSIDDALTGLDAAEAALGRGEAIDLVDQARRRVALNPSASALAPLPNNRKTRVSSCARTSRLRRISPAAVPGGISGRRSPPASRA